MPSLLINLSAGGHRKRGGEVTSMGIFCFEHSIFLLKPHEQQEPGNENLFPEGDFSHLGSDCQSFRLPRRIVRAHHLSDCRQSGCKFNLLWIPLLIATMILMAIGIGLIVSAASLFFRDVKFIVEVFLTFGIFFTPVFYDVSMLGEKGKWLLINPVSPVLEGLSACIVRHQPPDLPWLAYAVSFALVSSLGGYLIFKHLEPAFAESI